MTDATTNQDALAAENAALRAEVVRLEARLAELEHLADTDTLTPLPNRRAFLRRLEGAIRMAQRHATPSAVLYIDLDGLKRINDEYGHNAGDAVLCEVARRLTTGLRATDLVARIGGDEFGLVLDHLGEADAQAKAIAITSLMADTPFDIGIVKVTMGVTVGVAAVLPGDSADAVLERADNAMYAKRLYRSQR